jgi:hypothetical protein
VKVLIATPVTQGDNAGDFCSATDGELVYDAGPCVDVINGAVWDCPCSIAFRGVTSGELTTTAMVADLDFGLREYEHALKNGLKQHGTCSDCAKSMANAARMLALRWPVGTVIERDRLLFRERLSH